MEKQTAAFLEGISIKNFSIKPEKPLNILLICPSFSQWALATIPFLLSQILVFSCFHA